MVTPRRARRQWRRALVVALALALLGTVGTYTLAVSGAVSFQLISPPAGATASGSIVQLTVLSPSQVTVVEGNAQKVAGVNLARVVVAEGRAAGIKVDVTWLDPEDAGSALRNPNSWLTFGLYYPIHSGTCTGSDPSTAISLSDGSTNICAALDGSATGPLVDSSGTMIISKANPGAYFIEGGADPASPTACASTGSTWCAPSGLGLSSQNVFYVTAAITTPGGIPPGQQGQTGSLKFFIQAHAV